MIAKGLVFIVLGLGSIWIGWTFRNKAEATADRYDKVARKVMDPLTDIPPVTLGPRYYRIMGPILMGLGVFVVLAGLVVAIFGGNS